MAMSVKALFLQLKTYLNQFRLVFFQTRLKKQIKEEIQLAAKYNDFAHIGFVLGGKNK